MKKKNRTRAEFPTKQDISASQMQFYSIKYSLLAFGVLAATVLIVLALIYLRAIAAIRSSRGPSAFTDFDAFYTAGEMYWSGSITYAYNSYYFFKEMARAAGTDVFMPWTYPPQFNFLTAALAIQSRPISYTIFMISGAILFLFTISRLSRDLLVIPLALTAPAMFVVVSSGQNSFLIATLISILCISIQANNKPIYGGFSLGLLVIKPHLAIGLGYMLVLQKRWNILIFAVLIIIFTSLLSTLTFGIPIWLAFTQALEESSNFLRQGLYPMDRMTSVYAFAFTITGGNYLKSIIFHIIFLGIAFGFIWFAILQEWTRSRILSISCIATLTASPYCYDYDTIIATVSFSLVARDLIVFSSILEKFLLLSLSWLMTSWGMISTFWLRDLSTSYEAEYSLGGLGLVGVTILLFNILRRSQRRMTKAF